MTPASAIASQAYRQRSVLSATPEQLVVMLYEGSVRFLTQGAAAAREGAIARSNERLQRAEAIIDELLGSLDLDHGGEIATNLRDLYLFCRRHLNEARLERDPAKIDQVARLMRDLGGAWSQLAQQ